MTKIKKYIEEYLETTILSIVQEVVKKELKRYKSYSKTDETVSKIQTISVKNLNPESDKNVTYLRIYRLVKKITKDDLDIKDVRQLTKCESDTFKRFIEKHPEYKSHRTIKRILKNIID